MSDLIEIEAKALITKEDYEKLASLFKDNKSYIQINYYIDTKNCDLRKKGLSLRVRFKDKKFEMTVKVPRTEGHIEKNVYITDEEFEGINDQTSFPDNEIKKYLEEAGIDTSKLFATTGLSFADFTKCYDGLVNELAFLSNNPSYTTRFDNPGFRARDAKADAYLASH